jgi:hypothetical protein
MAFTELELAEIEKAVGGLCGRRTRPELKSTVSIEYVVNGHDVTIFERRPRWDGTPGHTEAGIAKLKFTRSTAQWRLLWMRRDMKWHAYDTRSASGDLSTLVREVDEDEYGCFFG